MWRRLANRPIIGKGRTMRRTNAIAPSWPRKSFVGGVSDADFAYQSGAAKAKSVA
ncbi:hypothetical protein PLANPX_4695 [Lacipirellula parvula]|uniref:Uncharacterized protein n=1 Tax=Lacipirellula parvula TaxID=2650471 RepID=A0A5K7XKZ2_9BACT|nr:hypothetical protein PLANPX_4695 [Lacipirellula parvula]